MHVGAAHQGLFHFRVILQSIVEIICTGYSKKITYGLLVLPSFCGPDPFLIILNRPDIILDVSEFVVV